MRLQLRFTSVIVIDKTYSKTCENRNCVYITEAFLKRKLFWSQRKDCNTINYKGQSAKSGNSLERNSSRSHAILS